MMMERVSIALAALLLACGPDMRTDTDDGSVDTDGGRAADGGGDAGQLDDGGRMDAGTLADGGDAGSASSDGGVGECGSDPVPPGLRLPRSCEETRCHGTDACAMAMLEGWDFTGYTACGATSTFDPGSSALACMDPPPFGYTYSPTCGRFGYAGTVRLFCDPDSTSVVAYFWGSMVDSASGPVTALYAGHEYQAGSTGGSGLASFGEPNEGSSAVDFQGIEEGRAGDRLQIWFLTQDAFDPSVTNTTGGFEVDL